MALPKIDKKGMVSIDGNLIGISEEPIVPISDQSVIWNKWGKNKKTELYKKYEDAFQYGLSNGFLSKSSIKAQFDQQEYLEDVFKNHYQQEFLVSEPCFPVFYNCGFYGNSSYSNPNPSTVSNHPNKSLTVSELQHIQENNKKIQKMMQESLESKYITETTEPEKKQKKLNRFQLMRIPKSV